MLTDARRISTASPRMIGEDHGISSYYVIRYYCKARKFNDLYLNEAINVAQNQPLVVYILLVTDKKKKTWDLSDIIKKFVAATILVIFGHSGMMQWKVLSCRNVIWQHICSVFVPSLNFYAGVCVNETIDCRKFHKISVQ